MCSKLHIVLCLLTSVNVCLCSEDPCNENSHKLFPQRNFGARNEKCPSSQTSTCDMYFKPNWYIVENAAVLNHCPTSGFCGVTYPAWMHGTIPNQDDGIVNRTACIKYGNECCKENVTMQIKNCTSFLVYYFVPLTTCPMGYCFESELPCEPPTTTQSPGVSVTTYQVSTDADASNNSKDLLIGVSFGVTGIVICIGIAIFVGMKGKFPGKRAVSALPQKRTMTAEVPEVQVNKESPG